MNTGGVPWLHEALKLARRAYGRTSPNPLVGAVLVKDGKMIGQGWHHRAGEPHAEVEAIQDAMRHGNNSQGSILYVTLEPCCTHGRTPPCTDAILEAGIAEVVVAAVDPNPVHAGKGLKILRDTGVRVTETLLPEAAELNEAFNHWIVNRTPFVTVKAAMSADGKIATVTGESKWITSEKARQYGMRLRLGSDAILVGVNTVIADDPSLTVRTAPPKPLRRIILDPLAQTPLKARVVTDESHALTTLIVTRSAPESQVEALAKQASVLMAPEQAEAIDLDWLLKELGRQNITSLLVEGGGETNAGFLLGGFAHKIAFFYAPILLGGRIGPRGVAGTGIQKIADKIVLRNVRWKKFGPDMLLMAYL